MLSQIWGLPLQPGYTVCGRFWRIMEAADVCCSSTWCGRSFASLVILKERSLCWLLGAVVSTWHGIALEGPAAAASYCSLEGDD